MNICIDLFVLETARTKINDFDLRMFGMRQEDVLGFQVTVNNLVAVQQDKTIEYLFGEATNKLEGETSKVVSLDEFVKVHTE